MERPQQNLRLLPRSCFESEFPMLNCRGNTQGFVPQLVSQEAIHMSGHSKWATIKHKKAATDAKHGGNMAETGAVGWMFQRKGDIVVSKEKANEDKMLSIVLDAGAEDLRDDGEAWEVLTPPESFEPVREALVKDGITPDSAEVGWVPQNYVKLSGTQAAQMLRLVEALEEHDDVQKVSANFDIDEKEMQAVMAAQ